LEGRVYVGYCRVSTDRQGRSGLGLEAQRAAIEAFLKPGDRLIEPIFVEVESGRKTARPELQGALRRCRETGATLLVAKLDRLSRNVPFLRSLVDGDVDVAFADMPSLNGAIGRFMLTQMAAVAELEAGLISERTKAALAAAKVRGVKLGGDRGYRPPSPPDPAKGSQAAAEARKTRAAKLRVRLRPAVEALWRPGMSLRETAKRLNEQGIPGPSGRAWNHWAVKAVLAASRTPRITRPSSAADGG
jgi:DNA invertase Pin-like site-specific DNA recombinase